MSLPCQPRHTCSCSSPSPAKPTTATRFNKAIIVILFPHTTSPSLQNSSDKVLHHLTVTMAAFVSTTPVSIANKIAFAKKCSTFTGAQMAVAPKSIQGPTMFMQDTFKKAIAQFAAEYPQFASKGWGCTVKAERWNGRHAMFGMLAIVLTAYAKGHGMIPEGSKLLDPSQWGPLAATGMTGQGISNERAIILVAHIHVLIVSVAAALAPFSFQDPLLIPDGEKDEAPAGLIPSMSFGLTKDAEIWNGRLAMLGIMAIVGTAVATGSSILDVVNVGVGKILF